MSIRKMRGMIASVDGSTIRVLDEHGATFVFAASPEDEPRVMTWQKGNQLQLRQLGVQGGYPWKGSREGTGKSDSAFMRQVI